jgi:hypothetical protein
LRLDHVLTPRRDRSVQVALPPINSVLTEQARGLKAHDIAGAMTAITRAAACGSITPGEASELAQVVATLLRAIESSGFDRRLQLLEEARGADA